MVNHRTETEVYWIYWVSKVELTGTDGSLWNHYYREFIIDWILDELLYQHKTKSEVFGIQIIWHIKRQPILCGH